MNLDRGSALAAFHYSPSTMQTPVQAPMYPAQAQAPANSPVGNLALFPFKTRDGSAPKPNSPSMTGSLQFSLEQLAGIYQWATRQQPDAYGKIRIGVSVWNTVAETTGQPYLKGNVKLPVSPPNNPLNQAGVSSPMVAAMASQQQAANAAVQQQVYGQPASQPIQTQWQQNGQQSNLPSQAPMNPPTAQMNGNPQPINQIAYDTPTAYAQQQQSSVQQPMPSAQPPLTYQNSASSPGQPAQALQQPQPVMQPASVSMPQTGPNPGNQGVQDGVPF